MNKNKKLRTIEYYLIYNFFLSQHDSLFAYINQSVPFPEDNKDDLYNRTIKKSFQNRNKRATFQ